MQKSCRKCCAVFNIRQEDLKFYEKVSPVFKEKKYLIPPPTLCPDCRMQRRLAFRNELSLYNNQCDLCKKDIISIYHPQSLCTVYCPECWWSDAWNPMKYASDFDFSESFFQQFSALMFDVPQRGLHIVHSENSNYTNYSRTNKNCYLSTSITHSENCLYSARVDYMENCSDCFYSDHCHHSYELLDCDNCYNSLFLTQCSSCSDSAFLSHCNNCQHCLFCCNLRNKQYYFQNKKISKIEFEQKRKELDSWQSLMKAKIVFAEQSLQYPKPFCHIKNCENCTGDQLKNCKNCSDCFDIYNSENCKFHWRNYGAKDCQDCWAGADSELLYEGVLNSESYHVCFSMHCTGSSEIFYSDSCPQCSHLFGCVGLKHKHYCILNKQYTKEEYEALVPKIIEHMMKTPLLTPLPPLTGGQDTPAFSEGRLGGIYPSPPVKGDLGGYEEWRAIRSSATANVEWGEFFPAHLSPFGYNETVANEYYPLTREQALGTSDASNTVGNRHAYSLQHRQIFNWSDYESPKPDVKKIIPAEKLPNDIKKIPNDILNWAIECEITKKPFRIIKQELEFYRQHNLPIPRRHPDQRHKDRLALRNPRKLWTRNCMNCKKEIQTTYAPERPEIVYCEECYLKEVY